MTNEEIEKYKQELCEIYKIGILEEQWKQLTILAKKLNAPIPEHTPPYLLGPINQITHNIHTVLQTETMLNACVSAEQSSTTAKRACIWAAVAAIVTLIGAVASWVTVFITVMN
jgi:hypothetical protein